MRAYDKARYSTSYYRSKDRERYLNPEFRDKKSEYGKIQRANPEYKAKKKAHASNQKVGPSKPNTEKHVF